MVKIRSLNKYFNKGKPDEIHVIDNTTLEFNSCGLVCILGESGSGKTTLLNTIGGLDSFQSGEVTVNDITFGRNSMKGMEKLRNDKFGYIFQDQYLLSDYSAEYNIRLALNMYDISEQEKEARIDYCLQAVDMKKYKKRLISQLSGGQKQRIAIARALVKSPDIIFADEPTGNLDEANTMRIMSIIKKISKECLVILVTHNKQITDVFADRIIYISNGRITGDSSQAGRKTYQYSDDMNLYLKEYKKETYQSNNIRINLYNPHDIQEGKDKAVLPDRIHKLQENKQVSSPITVNMVYSEGRLYIQTENDKDVVLLTSGDETQMVEGNRPEFDLNQAQDFEFTLSPIKKRKRPKLSWREIWNLANENVRMLGKKQFFLVISLIITSILLVIIAADYLTAAAINKESIITEDSHYVEIMGKRNASVDNKKYYESFDKGYQNFIKNNPKESTYICLDTILSFTYDGFGQTKQLSYSLSDFSYVTLDHFKKENLVSGRMPVNRNEIIIDKWLIDKFEDSDSVLKTFMPDRNSFLNLRVRSDVTGQELTIVGICDLGEPTVYIDKYAGISIAAWADKIASLKQLKKEYPGKYDDMKLAPGEVLVSEKTAKILKSKGKELFNTKADQDFKVAGTFPDGFGVTYVIDDIFYKEILNSYICSSRRFLIYTDNKENLLKLFQKKGGYDTDCVKFIAADHYSDQLTEFKEAREAAMDAHAIITIVILVLTMLMLYFTMKSNVMKITQELSVYRLVGISKSSIIEVFILEVIIITSYTVLPVVLIFSSVIKFLIAIPSLQSEIYYPWYAVAAVLVFMYVVNILVGVIPVYNVIKRPPAQIAGRA